MDDTGLSYRLLIENFPDGVVFGFDDDLRYTVVGGEGLDALGIAADELEGSMVGSTFPEVGEALVPRFRAALSGEEGRFDVEVRGRSFRVQLLPVTGEDGEVRHGMGIAQDVTERTRMERELRESAGSLRSLYDVTTASVPFEEKLDAVIDLGRERLDLPYGFLTEIDGEVQRIVAADGDHERLQPGESCPLSRAYCRRTIRSDGLLGVADAVGEGWEDDPAYEAFELGCYVGTKVIVDGDLYGTFCFAATEPREGGFTDSERTFVRLAGEWIGYELDRERKRERLERQNERLERFASVVSHDLRNPMNVLAGSLELARESGDEEHFDRAEGALSRMERLVDDLLDLARQGETVTDPEPVSLPEAASRAWETVDTDGARLRVEADLTVTADGSRLRQLLENLFRNAVEHSSTNPRQQDEDAVEHGSTSPRSEDPVEHDSTSPRRPDENAVEHGSTNPRPETSGDEDSVAGNGAEVTVVVGGDGEGFFVEDDGPGVPEEDRDRIFESGYTTREGGTGLGLAIVREIAEAHGWEVHAKEGRDGGLRVEVTGIEPAGGE